MYSPAWFSAAAAAPSAHCVFLLAGLATRQFDPGTKLSDRVGRNEKQRITVRLQRPTEANQTAGNKRKKSAAASKKAVAATVEVAQTASAGAEGGPVKSAAAAVVDSHMLRHYVHQRFGVAQSAKRPRVSSAKVEDPDEVSCCILTSSDVPC
jgi:hypothetical protein